MSDAVLREIRDLIQRDVNRRGLATDPEANLINACPDDFAGACRSIAETPNPVIGVVTGFYIADANPPAGETDGPLGALFLARALTPLGIRVNLIPDYFCKGALHAGLEASRGCRAESDLVKVILGDSPPPSSGWSELLDMGFRPAFGPLFELTHLIALERGGPSHTRESLQAQAGCTARGFINRVRAGKCCLKNRRDGLYSMRGRDLSEYMGPTHRFFENAARPPRITTIGIGDGGNEIGMGKIPWDVIRRNIPNGGLIACRVPTDHLIVCGVSNWGAYALAAGVALLRGAKLDPSLFDPEKERELLRIMVEKGPLVDGVTGRPTVTVDGLSFDEYVKPLLRIKDLLRC